MKQRIYIDTSVIGGSEDEEFSQWPVQLFEEFRQGLRIAVISDLTRREIEKASESVRKILSSLFRCKYRERFSYRRSRNLSPRIILMKE